MAAVVSGYPHSFSSGRSFSKAEVEVSSISSTSSPNYSPPLSGSLEAGGRSYAPLSPPPQSTPRVAGMASTSSQPSSSKTPTKNNPRTASSATPSTGFHRSDPSQSSLSGGNTGGAGYAAANGLPRLSPAHLGTSGSGSISSPIPAFPHGYQYQLPPHTYYTQQPYPSYAGLSSYTHPQFPHPQFPFIPSPHPGTQVNGGGGVGGGGGGFQPGPYSPGFVGTSQSAEIVAHQQRLLQQAQWQQQQWQAELMRNQGMIYGNAGAGSSASASGSPPGDWSPHDFGGPIHPQSSRDSSRSGRQRAVSGPAPSPSHLDSFYNSGVPYPPSPAPSFHGSNLLKGVTLPPVLNQTGYPTPPASNDGVQKVTAPSRSTGSSNGSGTNHSHHPYRRDRDKSSDRQPTSSSSAHNNNNNNTMNLSSNNTKASQTHLQQQQQLLSSQLQSAAGSARTINHQPGSSSTSSDPSTSSGGSSSSAMGHNRAESSTSSLSIQNYPNLPSSMSTQKVGASSTRAAGTTTIGGGDKRLLNKVSSSSVKSSTQETSLPATLLPTPTMSSSSLSSSPSRIRTESERSNVSQSSYAAAAAAGAQSGRPSLGNSRSSMRQSVETARERKHSAPTSVRSSNLQEQQQQQHSFSSSSSVNSSSERSSGRSSPSGGSATIVAEGGSSLVGKRPSPLSQQHQDENVASSSVASDPEQERPGTPGTLRGRATPVSSSSRRQLAGVGDDSAEDSDDTASGPFQPEVTNLAHLANSRSFEHVNGNTNVSRSGKEKKKGSGGGGGLSRFKKAFSLPSSNSNLNLTESDINGIGPKDLSKGVTGAGKLQKLNTTARRNSVSNSIEDKDNFDRLSPPTATFGHHHHQHSHHSNTNTSSSSSSSRPPPVNSNSSKQRFGMLSKSNTSTDNLSISSTVSSASMMIRKIGQIGKLARRNSLMGLTKAFKSTTTTTKDDKGEVGNKIEKGSSKKKGSTVGVSHATAEIKSEERDPGISPAAALAKKQQRHYAEQEAVAVASASASAAAAAAAVKANASRSSSDPISAVDQSKKNNISSNGSGMTMDKEKDRLKKSKGRKWGFGGGSNKNDEDAPSVKEHKSIIESKSASPGPEADTERFADSEELLVGPTFGGTFYRDDSGDTEYGNSDYEPSLTERPPTIGHRRDAKAAKGILKGSGCYNQEDFATKRPNFSRSRANSYDAPLQHERPTPSGNAALVGVIPSEQQVDGLAPATTSPRLDTHAHIDGGRSSNSSGSPPGPSTPYLNADYNKSAPVLKSTGSHIQQFRSATSPVAPGRRIHFATNLSVHTTWPAAIYDRRAEPATCNRLTPLLAARIKEELNSYKMEEMEVHPTSRQLTHFFV